MEECTFWPRGDLIGCATLNINRYDIDFLPCVRPSTSPREVGEHCAGFNFSPQTNGYIFMKTDIDFAGAALHRNFLDGQSAREGKAIARIKIGYDRRSAASFQ